MKMHQIGNKTMRFSPEVVEIFSTYPWPGNVRELGNVVAYLMTMTDGDEVDVADLPSKFRDFRLSLAPTESTGDEVLYERIAKLERQILEAEYKKHGGNVTRLALALKMDRSHL